MDASLRSRMLRRSADERQIVLTRREFDDLLEYNMTLPTGTTLGKRWKWRRPVQPELAHWFMGEYFDDGTPGMVAIRWREIVVCDAGGSR